MPVIIGVMGIVSKSLKNLEKYQDNIQQILYKNIHTKNITHHKESATTCDLKPEWRGSPLAQEKYQGKERLW
jgi:hypothetical protein